ncbi:hypothetical protein KM043_001511 [Ampulex compressa]|nr:hypothetical protein KM043_001511 [Ampulex compressa]
MATVRKEHDTEARTLVVTSPFRRGNRRSPRDARSTEVELRARVHAPHRSLLSRSVYASTPVRRFRADSAISPGPWLPAEEYRRGWSDAVPSSNA